MMRSARGLLGCLLLIAAACGKGAPRPATDAAPPPIDAPAVDAAPATCDDLLTTLDVVNACGVPGTVTSEAHVFDTGPACSFSLQTPMRTSPIEGPVMHAVVRRFASAEKARETYPLDDRAPHITVITGLGDAAIDYRTQDPKLGLFETLAFNRGPLHGFIETTDGRCNRAGREAIARVLLARLRDGAGPP